MKWAMSTKFLSRPSHTLKNKAAMHLETHLVVVAATHQPSSLHRGPRECHTGKPKATPHPSRARANLSRTIY